MAPILADILRDMTASGAHGLLFVHAHPDDECINNGASMALYAAAGLPVTLVTCTRGEEGEVLVPELEHLRCRRTTTTSAPTGRPS